MKKKVLVIIIAAVIVVGGATTVFALDHNQNNSKNTTVDQTKSTNAPATKSTTTTEKSKSQTPNVIDYSNFQYVNINYDGISMECPSFLVDKSVTNGQEILKSSDGTVTLELNKIQNEHGITSYYNSIKSNLTQIGFNYLGKNTYSLAFANGNNEVYECGIVNGNSIITFKLTYPKDKESNFDTIIPKVYSSFISNIYVEPTTKTITAVKTTNNKPQTVSTTTKNTEVVNKNNSNATSNESSQKSNTTTSSNTNQIINNPNFTYDVAAGDLKQYLTLTGQWQENHGRYSYELENDGQNTSEAAYEIGKEFANDPQSKEYLQNIENHTPNYAINYMCYVMNTKQSGYTNRIGTYYLTSNAIYLQNMVNMQITKVANIENGTIELT
ncbi:MAG: hypothetical protein ACRDDY_14740 [Clostridium sp.]|uniref:hypothetical protein n=1 Tax=Clostridium sp. TaxID=1506 RepID=UPI003EE55C2F